MMKRSIIFSLCLVWVFSNLSRAQNHLLPEIDKLLREEFSDNEPGGSVLIKKADQKVFLCNYGLADMKTGEKITENTVFNTGSISKTFVAYGILILEEREMLSLEDPILKYFDDFDNKQIAQNVTIKHLLSHTSGLPDLRKVSENRRFYLTAKDKENWKPIKKVQKLNFKPGEKFEYSNPAFNGLALIIEKITEKPWQQFIQDEIFQTADMSSSKITDGPYPENGVAHAYDLQHGEYIESDYGEFPTFAAAGNGGIWSTVLDLAKYEQAIQSQKFLSRGAIDQSRTVFEPVNWIDGKNPFIGFSWFLGEESLFDSRNRLGVDIVYHTGSQGGFRAIYLCIPHKNILLIGLFNRPVEDFPGLIYKCLQSLQRKNWLDE